LRHYVIQDRPNRLIVRDQHATASFRVLVW